MTSTARIRVAILLVAVVHAALIGGFGMLHSSRAGGVQANLFACISNAAMRSSTTLLLVWMSFGGGRWFVRCFLGVAAAAALHTVVLLSWQMLTQLGGMPMWVVVESFLEMTAYIAFMMLSAASVGLLARRGGWGLTTSTDDAPPYRFSIAELFTITLFFCVLLTALRALLAATPRLEAFHAEFLNHLDMASGMLLIGVGYVVRFAAYIATNAIGVVAVAGRRPRVITVVGAVACGYLLGLATWFASRPMGVERLSEIYGFSTATGTALTIASLLALRAAGLRIDREPRVREETVAENPASS